MKDYALLAPQATNGTWYPVSFIAPVEQNEPWFSSAIETVGKTVQTALDAGIIQENIYFFGFSLDVWFHLGNFENNIETNYQIRKKGNGVYAFILKCRNRKTKSGNQRWFRNLGYFRFEH